MALFALRNIEAADDECCEGAPCCQKPTDGGGSGRRTYGRGETPSSETSVSSNGYIIGVSVGVGALFILTIVIVGVILSVRSNRNYHNNRGAVFVDQTRPSGNFGERSDFNVAPSPMMVTQTNGTSRFTPSAYPENDSEISVSMRNNDHTSMPQAKVPSVPYPLGEAGPQPGSQ
ncbi:hypothetical protein AAVH_03382 [Aphelenchoides avenae]|nr:hypothetical protein AAVH_03382 [Aphelenchus avenae]